MDEPARRHRRAGAAAAAFGVGALLSALLPAGAARAATATVPGYVQVLTEAAGVQVVQQQNPPLGPVTNQLFRDTVGYAASSLDSGGGSEAAAAAFYPGTLVVQGPQLVCSEFAPMAGQHCPTEPPQYPLLADAQYPSSPKDSAALQGRRVGQAPLTLTAGTTTATAAERHNEAQTTGADVSLPVLTVGSVTARTTTAVASDGVHVRVESLLKDVTIAGQVHVAAIRAVDDVLVPEGGKARDEPTVTLTGVTVAGQAATVDQDGVHVGGKAGPALLRGLEQRGLRLSLVGTSRKDTPGAARSAAFGLALHLTQNVSGVPQLCGPVVPPLPSPPSPLPDPGVHCPPDLNRGYETVVTLGAVGATAVAQHGDSFDFTAFPAVPPGPQALGVGAATLSPASAGGAGRLPSVAAPAGGGAAAAPEVAGQPAGFSPLRVDLSTLYLVLALLAVAGFGGWRLVTAVAGARRRT